MKCPNCGAGVNDDVTYCPNCGSNIKGKNPDADNSSRNNPDASRIVGHVLSEPKLLAVIVIVVILIFGLTMFGSNGDSSNQGYSRDDSYERTIGGFSFNIPKGFEESYHSGPFGDGSETVDFKSSDYDDLEISVSPKYNVDLNGKHVKVKTSKNIGGVDGILAFYDSNRVAFYFDSGDFTIALNSNSPDHDELFATVIE